MQSLSNYPVSESAIETLDWQTAAEKILTLNNIAVIVTGDPPLELNEYLVNAGFEGVILKQPVTIHAISEVGYSKWQKGQFVDPIALEPLYVSPPPIRTKTA